MQRTTHRSLGSRETCSIWSFGEDGNSYRHLYCRTFHQCTGTERREEIRTCVKKTRNNPNCVPIRVWSSILLKQKYNRCNIYAENVRCLAMRKDSEKRMGTQEYEDRPSLAQKKFAIMMCSIQYQSSNTMSVSRQYRFLCQIREWRWQVRNGIDAAHERRGHSFSETHC